jgi:hypothetical protein
VTEVPVRILSQAAGSSTETFDQTKRCPYAGPPDAAVRRNIHRDDFPAFMDAPAGWV